MRLHFQHSGGGTLKFEFQLATKIDIRNGSVGGHNDFHAAIVEFINQVNKAARQVIIFDTHHRDIGYQQGVKQLAQFNVVVL